MRALARKLLFFALALIISAVLQTGSAKSLPGSVKSEPEIITGNSIIRDYAAPKKRTHTPIKSNIISSNKAKPQKIQKKHRIPAAKNKVRPKNVIERSAQPNPFGHLSELLGIKGSFIPSQARQNWMGDEEQSSQSETDSEVSPEARPEKHYAGNELSSVQGTLPLDVSPQQANYITSTADSNRQRQKFMKWEHHGGSMDMQHYPSKFLRGEKDADKHMGEISSFENSQGLSTKMANLKMSDEEGPAYNRMKAERTSPKFEDGEPKKFATSSEKPAVERSNKVVGTAEKKGYMAYMMDQFEPQDEAHHPNAQFSAINNYMASKPASQNDQPLTHTMISNLQLDPAWDAMEAKMLEQHGHRVMPMRLPVNKIDREMMPPEGEPVGQAYLPQQRLHNSLVNDFHKAAGYPSQQAHSPSYYAHYQAHNGPHTINMGGTLVHALGDPWKNLKQTNYDQADDNFPVATPISQMQSVSSSTQATVSDGKAAENAPDKVSAALEKGKSNKIKQSSKFLDVKDSDNEGKPSGGKPKFAEKEDSNKETNGKKQSKKPVNDSKGNKVDKEIENEELELIKEITQSKQKEEAQQSTKNDDREQSNDKIQEETGPSKLIEDQNSNEQQAEEDNKQATLTTSKNINKNNFKAETDDKGSRFNHGSKITKGSSNRQSSNQQMHKGQQGFMETGNNQQQPEKQTSSTKAGQYITGKFVNFLSDVANHLNVDKLSIAEQLVKDVETNKAKAKNRGGETREANVMEGEENVTTARKLRASNVASNIEQEYQRFMKPKNSYSSNSFQIGRRKPEVIKYIWNKGISILKEE